MAEVKEKTFKWSQEMRRIVYRRLREKFGPFSSWPRGPSGRPPRYPIGKKPEYDALMSELAVEFGGNASQGKAVSQQADWGITRQGHVPTSSLFKTMILNKVAALEEKLITYQDLPSRAELFEE